ncbi:hypothetical protein B7R22_17050 [Subtercola boreus]|uniref:Molecular chaperone DnaJ n=1 Tax=Subtercola boreus TaxID=120213 RepID=A0A3E0VRR6_9MICO|nr:molecular chaperone DnaJ [Subtercola boreus]RFA12138.1 hypothetical protein B7R22_17050 [Subtercola boreus]
MWPDNMAVGPIREWPGQLTDSVNRRPSPFTRNVREEGESWTQKRAVPFSDTLALLDRELEFLGAADTELLLAIPPQKFRLDGKPYADAKAEHPGVILSFRTKLGALSYPCDTFTTWQDNLRAIALALEALRKVDRYGVTKHGEQYRGFMAIESGRAMPAGFSGKSDAWAFIKRSGGYDPDETPTKRLIRDALRKTHPDHGGESADFQRVTAAEQYLKQNGYL